MSDVTPPDPGPTPAPSAGEAFVVFLRALWASLPSPRAALAWATPVAAWTGPLALAMVMIHVHGCSLPPLPWVGPVVPDALAAQLQTAYDAEADPQKAVHAAALADVLANAVADRHGTMMTAKDFTDRVHADTNTAIGEKAIPKVRAAAGAYLVTVLPTDPNTPTSSVYWAKASKAYAAVAAAIKKAVK